MKTKRLLSLERIIGKIDNDFNIDNSDWIPRAGAWIIDALSQLKVLPMEIKKRELDVIDRIAMFPCALNLKSLKVYDSNGCQIPELTKGSRTSIAKSDEYIGVSEQSTDPRYRTVAAKVVQSCGKNYVISDNDKIELNFDTDKITVESYEVATYYDDYFNCNVPYVYDDGLLLEALSWYVLYKILCRGYKHQVFSLTGSEPVNPYVQWTLIKNKASASVINSMRKNGANEGWNNFFYNFTFLPKSY